MVAVNLNGTAIEPLDEVFFHTVVYYKYTVFRKFPIDLWENVCGWLSGSKTSFILNALLNNVLPFIHGNLTCPMFGNYFILIKNISSTIYDIPSLMPSGQYRIDINVTEKNRNNILATASLQIINSDNRIELV